MKYYIFKVIPTLGKPYYVLNNQYIGYIGCDSNYARLEMECSAGITHTYQLYAQSKYLKDNSPIDHKLHTINCNSTRFSNRQINQLLRTYKVFKKTNDRTIYEEYYPVPRSSSCILRSLDGKKTIE
jgi:hypothetical protein